jgi:DNA-binding CsgD family transcriptional regulator/tetratricopeptide (TPR) repeat protein
VLTRGAEAELEVLFPLLRKGPAPAPSAGRAAESSLQLHWTFAQFLKAVAARGPLLIVLDDLHWADASSLELLHFVARHLGDSPILLIATVNEEERSSHPSLVGVEQSLLGLGAAVSHRLLPLTRANVDELVREAFGIGESVTREFTALLFGWTRGNPYFIEETLKALVDAGRLHHERGQWLGWEMEALELPGSIRDALLLWLARLSPAAREIAEVVGVIGTRTRYETLRAVCPQDEAALVHALEELSRRNVLAENAWEGDLVYDFPHPMVRKIVVGEIGLARQRLLHGRVAVALERAYAGRALEHAEELALHFGRGAVEGGGGKAIRYLAAAGESALARFANREAAAHLAAALERIDAADPGAEGLDRFRLMEQLARAWQRLGEYERAIALWREARDDAARRGDLAGVASMERRIGLSHFWAGRHVEALGVLDAALAASGADLQLQGRIRMARGVCLYMVGKGADARAELDAALGVAEASGDPALLARVHRALLLFHAWAGEPEPAFTHGRKAIALAEQTGNLSVACACHWGMAVVAGLTGRSSECAHHLREGTRLADDLRSPLLRMGFDEIAVEYAFSTGDWDDGIALGEKAIAMARVLHQKTLLPRLLIWTGLIYLGRDERDRARAYLDEAWVLSGAADPEHARDMHSVIPAHIGMASYHLAARRARRRDPRRRGGPRARRRHRLHRVGAPPTARGARRSLSAEARPEGGPSHRQAVAPGGRADRTRARRRVGGLVRGDPGLARRRSGQGRAAPARRRRRARGDPVRPRRRADPPPARRQARRPRRPRGRPARAAPRARRLPEARRPGGAERARLQFHEVDARPPSRPSGPGVEGLTSREVEIIRLIATRRSNKAIGSALGISPRTVTTHLSNIYQKLEISSRGELADLAPRILSEDR